MLVKDLIEKLEELPADLPVMTPFNNYKYADVVGVNQMWGMKQPEAELIELVLLTSMLETDYSEEDH